MKSRIFFTTYIAANVGLILYGIIALLQPDILLPPFLAHVYQFSPGAADGMAYLSGLYRLLGYFNILPGVFGLLMLYRYGVTREGWYLKIVVVSTILTYLGPVVFDNTIGKIGFFEVLEHVLFVMILISGFMMLKYGDRESPQRNSSKSSPRNIISNFHRSHNPESGL